MKAAIAQATGDAGWNRLRPPLTPLDERQRQALGDALQGLSFTIDAL